MKEVCAFVVGIDRYDQKGWDLVGPFSNAVRITRWLLGAGVPPGNVFVFLEATDYSHGKTLDEFEADGVTVCRSATSEDIDTFWRQQLRQLSKRTSRLFFYWSGHGVVDKDGDRVFFCSDYRDRVLTTRLFNCTKVLRYLRAPAYLGFSEQICFFDVCATPTSVEIDPNKTLPHKISYQTNQAVYFATREGEYAKGTNGRGVFTQATLDALGETTHWPDVEDLAKKMKKALDAVDQKMFHVVYLSRNEPVWERFGKVAEDGKYGRPHTENTSLYLEHNTLVYLEILREKSGEVDLDVYIDLLGHTTVPRNARPCLPRSYILPDLVDTAPAQQDHELKNQKLNSIEEALALHKKGFVLLGDPGSGKTFSLQKMRDTLASKVEAGISSRLPLLIDLAIWQDRPNTIEDIFEQSKERYGLKGYSLESFVLLIDGLNEFAERDFIKISEELRIWLREKNQTPAIVACTSDFFNTLRKQNALGLGLPEVYILPLSTTQQKEYIQAYLKQEVPEGLDRILFSPHANSARYSEIRRLAKNPLFLYFIIVTFYNNKKYFPTSTGELLKDVMDLTFTPRNTSGDALSSRDTKDLQQEQKELLSLRNALASIALAMCKHGSSDKVHAHSIESSLSLGMPFKELINEGRNRGIIKLERENQGLIQFSHQLLRDYLAAEALLHDIDALRQLSVEDASSATFSDVFEFLLAVGDPDTYLQAITKLDPFAAHQHALHLSESKQVHDVTLQHIAQAFVNSVESSTAEVRKSIAYALSKINKPAIAPLLEGLSMSPPVQVCCLTALYDIAPCLAVSKALEITLTGAKRPTKKTIQTLVGELGVNDPSALCAILQEKWANFDKLQKQRVAELFCRLWPSTQDNVWLTIRDTVEADSDLWLWSQRVREQSTRASTSAKLRTLRSAHEKLVLDQLRLSDSISWPFVWLSLWRQFETNDDLARDGRKWLKTTDLSHTEWPKIWLHLSDAFANDVSFRVLGYRWLVEEYSAFRYWSSIWQKLYVSFRGDADFEESAYKWLNDDVDAPSSQSFVWSLLVMLNPEDEMLISLGNRILTQISFSEQNWPFVWELMMTLHHGDIALELLGVEWLHSGEGNRASSGAILDLLQQSGSDQFWSYSESVLPDLRHPHWPLVWLNLIHSDTPDTAMIDKATNWLEITSFRDPYWITVWGTLVQFANSERLQALRERCGSAQYECGAVSLNELRTMDIDDRGWPKLWRKLWYDVQKRPLLTKIGLRWLRQFVSNEDWAIVFKRIWIDTSIRDDLATLGNQWLSQNPTGHLATVIWRLIYSENRNGGGGMTAV